MPQRFQKISVGSRLRLGFTGLLTLVVVLGLTALLAIRSLSASLDHALTLDSATAAQVGQLRFLVKDMKGNQSGFVLFSMMNDTEHSGGASSAFQRDNASLRGALDVLRQKQEEAAMRADLDRLEQGRAEWEQAFATISRACGDQRCNEALDLLVTKLTAHVAGMDQLADRLTGRLEQRNREAAAQAQSSAAWKSTLVMLVLAVSGVLGFGIWTWVRGMNHGLRALSRELHGASGHLATVTCAVSDSGGSLASGAAEQSAAMRQMSHASEEISQRTQKTAARAGEMSELMRTASERVLQTKKTVKEMQALMSQMAGAASQVGKITAVVDSIAFRTNLLALNAAVEAARAGESGLGFAVVAEEVRNLAHGSTEAARETAEIIEKSIRLSRSGEQKIGGITAAVQELESTTLQVSALVDDVSSDNSAQAAIAQTVSASLANLESMAGQTATAAGQSAGAGKTLDQQTRHLQEQLLALQELVGA
jgi:hypothetical protein